MRRCGVSLLLAICVVTLTASLCSSTYIEQEQQGQQLELSFPSFVYPPRVTLPAVPYSFAFPSPPVSAAYYDATLPQQQAASADSSMSQDASTSFATPAATNHVNGEPVLAELGETEKQMPEMLVPTMPPDREQQFLMQQRLLQGYGYTAAQEAMHYQKAIAERKQYIASAQRWIKDTELKVKNAIGEVKASTKEKVKEEEEKIKLALETIRNLEAVDRETRKKFLANKKKLQEMAAQDHFPYMNEYATQAQYTEMFGNAARTLLEHVYANLRAQRNFVSETQQRIREANERLSDWEQDLSDSTKIEIENEKQRIKQSEAELKRLEKLLKEAENNIKRYDQELKRVQYEYEVERKNSDLREAARYARILEKELKSRIATKNELLHSVQAINGRLSAVNSNLKKLRVNSYHEAPTEGGAATTHKAK